MTEITTFHQFRWREVTILDMPQFLLNNHRLTKLDIDIYGEETEYRFLG